jgi:hypothetical protein
MDPAGPLSTALETLRTAMLAQSANFQLFLTVSSAPAAIAKTYLASLPPPQQVAEGDGSEEYTPAQWEGHLRPFCLCYTSPTGGYRITRTSRYGFADRGKLFIELETNAPANADLNPELADRTILNQIGQIIMDLVSAAGTAGTLDIAEISIAAGPSRERFEEEGGTGEYYWTLIELTWGPD